MTVDGDRFVAGEYRVLEKQIQEIAGVEHANAGLGFGVREMFITLPTVEEANAARERLIASGLELEIGEVGPFPSEDDEGDHDRRRRRRRQGRRVGVRAAPRHPPRPRQSRRAPARS